MISSINESDHISSDYLTRLYSCFQPWWKV